MTEKYLLYNAKVYCGLPYAQPYNAILIEGDTIRATGAKALRQPKDMSTHLLDLNGATVWPGLVDSHLHLAYLGERLQAVDCETSSLAELLRRVETKCLGLPADQSWVIGYGFNHNDWQPAIYPTREDLDRVSHGHPVLIHAKSLHASWANSLALELSGIGPGTADPVGGLIQRDSGSLPTGILLENATSLVMNAIPKPDLSQSRAAIKEAQAHLFSMGVTSVHDFDRWEALHGLFALQEAGELQLNVVKQMHREWLDQILREDLRGQISAHGLLPGWIKCFADGALGPQSAAMLQPYENSAETGMLLISEDELLETGKLAAEGGWPLSVHAIGDAANRTVLRAFARLRAYEAERGLPHLLHRIEHCQLLHPDDIAEFKRLNIIASMQPIHATSDMHTAQRHWGARNATSYAWQALEQSGARLIFGSDAPVETASPFAGLHAAVTRRRPDGSPSPLGWQPQNRLSLKTALDAYTINPGLYCTPDLRGRLEAGWKADLIILDQDPFSMDPQDLWKLEVRSTMVNGQFVYHRA